MRLTTTTPKAMLLFARALVVDAVHLKDRLTPKDGNPANMVCSSGVRTLAAFWMAPKTCEVFFLGSFVGNADEKPQIINAWFTYRWTSLSDQPP